MEVQTLLRMTALGNQREGRLAKIRNDQVASCGAVADVRRVQQAGRLVEDIFEKGKAEPFENML